MLDKSKKNTLLLASVIHYQSSSFINEFINSIENQSLDFFDLLFVVESGINLDFLNFTKGKLHIQYVPVCDGPKKNRDTLLSHIHRLSHSIVVLQDSDDLLHLDRLRECHLELCSKHNTVLVSDIRPFYHGQKKMESNGVWANRFALSSGKPNISYNYYGLGNTAFTGDILTLDEIDFNIIQNIYDWEFYIQLYSAKRFKTIFGKKPVYYRQTNNTLGINPKDTTELKRVIGERYKGFRYIEESIIELKTAYKFWFET